MDTDSAEPLRDLLDQQPVAALATLHRGDPAVSMVPFVLDAKAGALWLHVSELATHTRDMREHARVALLIVAGGEGDASASPQARPRVSLQADARLLARDDEGYAAARALYLARFEQAAMMFELGDFSLVELRVVSARLVAGFGKAWGLAGPALLQWLRREPPG